MMQCTNTIYISNLNEKIKLGELKKALNAVFGQFGEIVAISALKNLKMRGQAFVAFKNGKSASDAVRQMSSFPFYDKPLKIQFAKCDSDCVAKPLGTYIKREKNYSSVKNIVKGKKRKSSENKIQPALKHLAQQSPPVVGTNITPNYNLSNKSSCIFSGEILLPPPPLTNIEPPRNKILFVTNLPPTTNQMLLNMIFRNFPGFEEIRTVLGKPEIAFVEFSNEVLAESAKNGLQGCKLADHAINISFAIK